MLEIREKLREANTTVEPATAKAKAKVNSWLLRTKVFLGAAPGFLKSSFSGTILFYVYETSLDNSEVAGSRMRSVIGCGIMAGLSHGIFNLLWDGAMSRTSFQWHDGYRFTLRLVPASVPVQLPYSVTGSLLGAMAVHTCLFSSYEGLKVCLNGTNGITSAPVMLQSMNRSNRRSEKDDDEDDEGEEDQRTMWLKAREAGGIALAGAFAGAAAETLTHYLEPVDRLGFRAGIVEMSSLPRPLANAVLRAMLPSSLGFLAYEYGKDTFS
jgi:hypothetical protein